MQFLLYIFAKPFIPFLCIRIFMLPAQRNRTIHSPFGLKKMYYPTFWVKKKVSNFWVKKRYSTFGVYPDFGFKKNYPNFWVKKNVSNFWLKRGRWYIVGEPTLDAEEQTNNGSQPTSTKYIFHISLVTDSISEIYIWCISCHG